MKMMTLTNLTDDLIAVNPMLVRKVAKGCTTAYLVYSNGDFEDVKEDFQTVLTKFEACYRQ